MLSTVHEQANVVRRRWEHFKTRGLLLTILLLLSPGTRVAEAGVIADVRQLDEYDVGEFVLGMVRRHAFRRLDLIRACDPTPRPRHAAAWTAIAQRGGFEVPDCARALNPRRPPCRGASWQLA